MTALLICILLLGIVLMATESLIGMNKAAIAIFFGVLCWLLLLFYGKGYVAAEHASEFLNFSFTTNSDSVREFIATNLFLNSIATACEVILYILATIGIVEVLDRNGCFDFIGEWLRTRNSKKLLWGMAGVTFLVSANLDNVTTIAMMLVIMLSLVSNTRQRMIYAAVVVLAANCGGALTVIGDTNSLLLWVRGLVTPSAYFLSLVLPLVVALVVPVAMMSKLLPEHLDDIPSPYTFRGDDARLKRWQRFLMLVVGIGGLWFIPTFHRITHFSPFVGALCVLSLLWVVNEIVNRRYSNMDEMITTRMPRAMQFVSFQTILFFLGISLMADAIRMTGWLGNVVEWCYSNVHNIYALGIVSGLASSVVDNTIMILISATTFDNMLPYAEADAYTSAFAQDGAYWALVNLCNTMGGSLLTIGTGGGYLMSRMGNVSLGWYVRFVSGKVLIGWGLALLVFWGMQYLTI